ncbi:MAG: cation:proton antiporter [Desulfuromonadales bacterium]|nr:cation:proton antiporter [Desulfuromonadales bacterium]NIR33547.1 cation:proton antiporter [Desulfuromonadales bacterium]NIS41137.1 cation:proton antiporter [Desulfuromonadales bacterium]
MIEQQHSMVVILLGVAVIPFFARRFRVPSAALEIAYGFILFNLLLTDTPEWFPILRELGFIYLMFIAGMELEIYQLRKSGRMFWYLLVSILSFTVTPLLFMLFGQPFFLGVAVSMISAGIVIPVLRELELNRTPFGRTLIGVALAGELLSILVLTFIDAYHKHGPTLEAALELLKLGAFLGLAFLVLKFLYLLAWWNPVRVEKVMESEDPVEEGIRAVVTVAFAGALLAVTAGAEAILGSFLAGMIFSDVFKSKGRFEAKINAVGFGFLIPFFFIGVGAQIDMALLASPQTVVTALVLTVMVLFSNCFPILLAGPLGVSLRESSGMALLLSAPLSMIVVAGTIGANMGLISAQTSATLVLTGLCSSILYPFAFRLLIRRSGKDGSEAAEAAP